MLLRRNYEGHPLDQELPHGIPTRIRVCKPSLHCERKDGFSPCGRTAPSAAPAALALLFCLSLARACDTDLLRCGRGGA